MLVLRLWQGKLVLLFDIIKPPIRFCLIIEKKPKEQCSNKTIRIYGKEGFSSPAQNVYLQGPRLNANLLAVNITEHAVQN